MSHEDVETARAAFAAWNEHGFQGLRRFLAPEFEFHEDPKFPESGVYRGPDEFGEYIERFLAPWGQMGFDLEDARPTPAGDVIVEFRLTLRGGGSGVEVVENPAWVWTIRDGLALRCHAFLDREEGRRFAESRG